MIPLPDPSAVLKEGSSWLQNFLATKRSRKVGNAANLLHDAGMTVVLLRTQRERLHRALGPLRDFRPHEWPEERRRTSIASIRDVIHDPARWYEVLNAQISGLRYLTVEPEDKVRPLRDEIEANARNVTGLGSSIYDQPAEHGGSPTHAGLRDLQAERPGSALLVEGRRSVRPALVGPDALIRDSLPALFWLIENAQTEKETDDLRRLASILLTTRSRRGDQDIDQVVGAAALAFGELKSVLRRQYPELPGPSWVDLPL